MTIGKSPHKGVAIIPRGELILLQLLHSSIIPRGELILLQLLHSSIIPRGELILLQLLHSSIIPRGELILFQVLHSSMFDDSDIWGKGNSTNTMPTVPTPCQQSQNNIG